MTTVNRMVTAGETDGGRGRPAQGWPGLAGRVTPLVREDPHQATENHIQRCPQGQAKAGEDERPIRQITPMTTTPVQRTTDQNNQDSTCSCGKTLKNRKGLRIHQGKMGCPPILNIVHRTETSGETEEEPGPETPHSAQSLHVSTEGGGSDSETASTPEEAPATTGEAANRRERVEWPKASEKKAWQAFDDDVNSTLESVLAGGVDRKVEAMTTIIYSMGHERFGAKELKARETPSGRGNRRETEISQIRGELKGLKRAYIEARESGSVQEMYALEELRETLRERLKSLRRAENNRRRRKERMRKRAQFTAGPFQFIKKLLGDKRSGRLECPREEVEQHLRQTHSDSRRDEELGDCPQLLQPEEPTTAYDESEPKWKEVEDIIKKARAASAPGPNGVPYRVYKNCPQLARRLWRLLRVAWRRGKMTESWMEAEGCFIPKEDKSTRLSQFRTISLLNVEGKIFLAVAARRLTSFMLANDYIDISVQKGGVPGVSGCVEHTGALTQIIREARDNKGDLAVLWLDLANAYGSIPHQLVQLTLQRYHVPERTRTLLQDYFDRFRMRFTVGSYTTAWQRLEVGIVTGCTISVILFAAAMNLVVKSAEKASRGPKMKSGVRQPPTRAFMDDMTVTAKSVVEGRWMLEDLEKLISWARMRFKPAKSRSLVLQKGKVQERSRFKVGGQVIPTVSEQPVKSLGKWFTADLNDRESVREMTSAAVTWMEAIEKSGLPGKFKAWCYQHGVLPRILWPLLMYEVPATTVESLERKMSQYLRRWLGVPRTFTSIGLYSTGCKMQLPLTSVMDTYKTTKARAVMTLRSSKDPKIREAGIEVRTGRKWDARKAVSEAESRLQHQDIVGTVAQGRLGLGCVTRASWRTSTAEERSKMVQQEVRQQEEEVRQARAVSMKSQGSWMRWEGVRGRDLSWGEIWKMEGQRIRFLLKSVYDVLPSPTNLCVWGIAADANCKLCQKPANLKHVLSACSVALADGRYTWRHDQVLKVIAERVDIARRQERKRNNRLEFIKFQKAGEKGTERGGREQGILATATDWKMAADIGGRMAFPQEVAVTQSRPDIVLWSPQTRQVVMVELTVPWEERVEESHELKRQKYQPLVEECQDNQWRAWCLPVEVGCRGFAAQSLWRAFRLLGITGTARKKTIGDVCREAESASRWVWMRREERWKSGE